MSEVNFYIWFFSAWACIGVVLGYYAMQAVLSVINQEDKTEKEKGFISELEESCNWLGKSIGISPIKMLFVLIYTLCILLWPYFLYKRIFKGKK